MRESECKHKRFLLLQQEEEEDGGWRRMKKTLTSGGRCNSRTLSPFHTFTLMFNAPTTYLLNSLSEIILQVEHLLIERLNLFLLLLELTF
jgi:hypothetical protein